MMSDSYSLGEGNWETQWLLIKGIYFPLQLQRQPEVAMLAIISQVNMLRVLAKMF